MRESSNKLHDRLSVDLDQALALPKHFLVLVSAPALCLQVAHNVS